MSSATLPDPHLITHLPLIPLISHSAFKPTHLLQSCFQSPPSNRLPVSDTCDLIICPQTPDSCPASLLLPPSDSEKVFKFRFIKSHSELPPVPTNTLIYGQVLGTLISEQHVLLRHSQTQSSCTPPSPPNI